jgi:hypothetical protein
LRRGHSLREMVVRCRSRDGLIDDMHERTVAERARKLFYEGGIPEFALLNERKELKGEKWAHRGTLHYEKRK